MIHLERLWTGAYAADHHRALAEPMLAFQAADPDVLQQRLADAGLRDITIDTHQPDKVEIRRGLQLWDWAMGGNPIPGMLVADLTGQQHGDIIAVLDGMVRERAKADFVAVVTAPVNIGVGTK